MVILNVARLQLEQKMLSNLPLEEVLQSSRMQVLVG
jgi:hypothetical protein